MARNKYIKDYRLLETFDEKGRVHTETEYIGSAFVFQKDPGQVKKAKRVSALACLLGWVFFIGGLFPACTGMHTLYVSLPYAFSALFLGMLTEMVLTIFRAKEPLENRFADKFNNRFPPVTMGMAVLSGASLAGEFLVFVTGRAVFPGDIVFALCGLLYFLCACLAFSRRSDLETRKQ